MPKRWSSGCSLRSRSRWSSSDCRWRACTRRSTWKKACRCSSSASSGGCNGSMPNPHSNGTLPIRSSEDIVRMRQTVRERAVAQGFSLVDQTKIVTAASELARNTLDYGGGGEVEVQVLVNGSRAGLRLSFVDRGPGIADIDTALRDGYTSGNGPRLGPGRAKRLAEECSIGSKTGGGTRGAH